MKQKVLVVRSWKFWLPVLALAGVVLILWGSVCPQEGGLTNFQRWQVQRTCRSLTGRYAKAGDRDAQEAALMDAGYPVMDTQAPYPSYLANAEGLEDFWQRVQAGKNAAQNIFLVDETGGIRCMVFRYEQGQPWFAQWSQTGQWEERPILDWGMTDSGTLFYQLYPRDIHYMTYAVIETQAPDRQLYDMTQTYILPVCYQAVNLFLKNWQEGNWGQLSFNDLLEYLYFLEQGEKLAPGDYPYNPDDPSYQEIPAREFEETILPYFNISREQLRTLAHYDPERDCYPWVIYTTNDVIWFPYMEPRVSQCAENPDGTLTLTVEVASRDFITEQFYIHQVTVRPMEDGGFQYVSNQILHQSDYGLPFSVPRRDWDELGT